LKTTYTKEEALAIRDTRDPNHLSKLVRRMQLSKPRSRQTPVYFADELALLVAMDLGQLEKLVRSRAERGSIGGSDLRSSHAEDSSAVAVVTCPADYIDTLGAARLIGRTPAETAVFGAEGRVRRHPKNDSWYCIADLQCLVQEARGLKVQVYGVSHVEISSEPVSINIGGHTAMGTREQAARRGEPVASFVFDGTRLLDLRSNFPTWEAADWDAFLATTSAANITLMYELIVYPDHPWYPG
jgi:hypothetical protein